MKSGTESKTKFRNLKRKLRLKYWEVVGVLETLWRVTQNDAPAGDIGKLANDDIASALEWEGDPDELINALIETRWIDKDDEFRLIIHDWSEHAPNHLKGAFERYGKKFADQVAKQRGCSGSVAIDDAKHTAKHDAKQGAIASCPSSVPEHHATKPNQTKPILTQPNHPQTPAENRPAAGLAGGGNFWDIDSKAAVKLALDSVNYKRSDDLIKECRAADMIPDDVLSVVKEYRANKTKFSSPGAIAEKLRSGVWPVGNVTPIDVTQAHKSKAAEEKRQLQIASMKRRLIDAGHNEARNWSDELVIAKATELKAVSQ